VEIDEVEIEEALKEEVEVEAGVEVDKEVREGEEVRADLDPEECVIGDNVVVFVFSFFEISFAILPF
jgi:hypothetical protein